MANEVIILAIFFITLGMTIFGMVLNKLLGRKKTNLIKLRDKILNLQKRMQNAQILGDSRMMQQLQFESKQLLKSMMTKQLLPLCARCIIFIALWIILDVFVFFNYRTGLLPFPLLFLGDGWVALYFLFAICLLALVLSLKLIYFLVFKKNDKRTKILKEIFSDENTLSTSQTIDGIRLGPEPIVFDQSSPKIKILDNLDEECSNSSWKDKI